MAESKTTISLCVPSPDEWEYRQKLYLDYDSTIHNAPYGDNGIDGVWFMSEEWLRGMFENLQNKSPANGQDWYAYILADGEPVGEVMIMPRNDNLVSIVIHAEQRGKGYAEIALRLLCEKAFDEFEMPYLIDEFPPERVKAERLFTKVGFVRENNQVLRLTRESFKDFSK
ncbi:MAG: GNAT family N-acetyltransferase [Oscillospiraceae bacterium]|nr:GNAT family N-acetyltransferase [Oscillospiraceae bacterium]